MKYILFLTIFFSLNAAGQVDTAAILHDYFKRGPSVLEYGSLVVGGVDHDSLYWKPYHCSHIYVAVLPDTVVWDKKPIEDNLLFTARTYPKDYVYGKPATQKIVCILCHKVTEQTVKVINEPTLSYKENSFIEGVGPVSRGPVDANMCNPISKCIVLLNTEQQIKIINENKK